MTYPPDPLPLYEQLLPIWPPIRRSLARGNRQCAIWQTGLARYKTHHSGHDIPAYLKSDDVDVIAVVVRVDPHHHDLILVQLPIRALGTASLEVLSNHAASNPLS